jgi:hypothetical protein
MPPTSRIDRIKMAPMERKNLANAFSFKRPHQHFATIDLCHRPAPSQRKNCAMKIELARLCCASLPIRKSRIFSVALPKFLDSPFLQR